MGINTLTGKTTMESIPDEKDRSKYSCTKWQFFLDAPFEISNACCQVMKKSPARTYSRKTGRVPMTAQMASESRLRTQIWLKQGCNAFDAKKPISNPMSFWTEQDVLQYVYQNKIPLASVYGDVVIDTKDSDQLEGQMSLSDFLDGDWELFDLDRPVFKTTGCNRSGCYACLFGCHLEKPGDERLVRLKETHPKLYDYLMRPWESEIELIDPNDGTRFKQRIVGLNYKEVIDWVNEHNGKGTIIRY